MKPQGNDFPKPNEGYAAFLRSRFTHWVVTIVSALVFAAAFPHYSSRGAVPAFVALVLLLQSLRGMDVRRARASGFLWGLIVYGVSLTWLWNLFHASTIALWAVLAVFIACFAWMQSLAEQRGFAGWRWVIFTAVNWGGWEFIRAELFPLKFPWITPGMACGPNVLLPWIGVYGVSAVMVLVAAIAASRKWMTAKILWVVAGALLFHQLSALRPVETVDPTHAVKVGLVQNEAADFLQFQKQSASLPSDVQLIVWPEHVLPYDLLANRRDMAALIKMCTERKAVLVVGTHKTTPDKKGWYNMALTLGAAGPLGEHYKMHPVHFFDDGTPGTEALPVKTPLGAMGTPICFDNDYEGVVRHMTAAGAEFFAVPSMDDTSWTAREHEQHAVLFRIRACENARWMAVCASSGVSQIIDPHGMVQGSVAALTVGELTGSLNRETRLTFYTRWGWLTPWTVLGFSLVCWVAILPWRGRRR